MQNDIITKIEKLLRLSKSPEQGEAENAMAMAIKLATQNNIDLNSINPDKSQKALKFKQVVWDGDIARLPIAQKFITPILIDLLQIKIVYCGGRRSGKKLHFVGTEDNAEMAMRMNNFLNHVFLELWRSYKASKNVDLKYRDSYFAGLAQGFKSKMKEAQKEVIAELTTSQQQQYGIVLVSQKEQVETFYRSCYDMSTMKTVQTKSKAVWGDAYLDGIEKGKQINFNSGALA